MSNSEIGNITDLQPLDSFANVNTSLVDFNYITDNTPLNGLLNAKLKINKLICNLQVRPFGNPVFGVSPYEFFAFENSAFTFQFAFFVFSPTFGAHKHIIKKIDFIFDYPVFQSGAVGQPIQPDKVYNIDDTSKIIISPARSMSYNNLVQVNEFNLQVVSDMPLYLNSQVTGAAKIGYGIEIDCKRVNPAGAITFATSNMWMNLYAEFFNNVLTSK